MFGRMAVDTARPPHLSCRARFSRARCGRIARRPPLEGWRTRMGQRILLFEADQGFAHEVRQQFEALGVTVDVANDGDQGLDIAAANRPDLILLTIELPRMNGFL